MKKLLITLLIILTAYAFYSIHTHRTSQKSAHVDFTPQAMELHTAEEKTPTEPKLTLLGTYTIYAYCPCVKCCGKTNKVTASGTIATEGRTVASTLPFGTKLLIDCKEYVVEDRGGGITDGKIDMFMDSHIEALKFGVQRLKVYEVRE